MISHLYTNDQTFRRILEKLEEKELRNLARKEVLIMTIIVTLSSNTEEISKYLFHEQEDYDQLKNMYEESISVKIASRLYRMNNEEIRSIYDQFVPLNEVVDDLMFTITDERWEIIAALWNWKVEDVRFADLIVTN
jgi:predicted transcriptional regulator